MTRNKDGTFKRNLVYGVGIDDIDGAKEWGVNGKRHSFKYYRDWKNMLKRCYCTTGDYLGNVSVSESWLTLSNFKAWFEQNYVEGYVLDKDILSGEVYSENTCLYIPKELNLFLTSVRKECGSYFDTIRGKYQSYTKKYCGKRINIGRFTTEREAVFFAKTVKMLEIDKLIRNDIFSSNINVGLSQLLDEMYFKFILNEVTQVGNCTFLDTGGCFKKYGNGYDLSIVKLSDYC